MAGRYPPINARFPHLLHGGDYNPDQWPEAIWQEDMRLMKLAHCNSASVGIFAWVKSEPAEGQFEFGWLDRIMDLLAENGLYAVVATPSGARPAWLSQKYPEVLRVRADRRRNLHGQRHNHCWTSPVYREKVTLMNTKMAERYKDHPALLMWHISNEYGGECHCDLCQAAFREWLQARYGSLDALNQAWWAAFWSHTYTDWAQIESPSPIGEAFVHGQNLDWKRYTTDQAIDFMRTEMAPLRQITPDIPITTNMMRDFKPLNYWKFAPEIDVISWDAYPRWHHHEHNWEEAARIAFNHDVFRSLRGGQPFMLMESTPSVVNWMSTNKLKRPGMHLLSSLQAVAHGADTVQYFQWRKSRGSSEKLHGAVVDHVGHEHTRVFREVTEVGQTLEQLDDVVGTSVQPQVAIIFDWENWWAVEDAQGPVNPDKGYLETCQRHYQAFWRMGIPVDVIDTEQDISGYRLVVAPMLYMVRPGVGERIEAFVRAGGTFVATYWSGIVNETDLCFLGGFPGPLRSVLGIWDEEIDALVETDRNSVSPVPDNPLGLTATYEAYRLCALIHAETASVLATYDSDFYAGRPAITVNRSGEGEAYYIAFRTTADALADFYGRLAHQASLKRVMETELPPGVNVQMRTDGERDFVFLMNFSAESRTVALDSNDYTDKLNGSPVSEPVSLGPYGVRVLERAAR